MSKKEEIDMTREQKAEILKGMSNEDLMKQYEASLKASEGKFEASLLEDIDLCRAEILNRMSR